MCFGVICYLVVSNVNASAVNTFTAVIIKCALDIPLGRSLL
jgi:hypothetical protein